MLHDWMHTTPYGFALALATIVGALATIGVWRRRKRPGGTYLFFMMVAGLVWMLFYVFELSFPALQTKLLWVRLEYIGVGSVPVLWYLFARAYTGSKSRPSVSSLCLLALVPVATLVMVFTNGRHHLMWLSASIEMRNSVPILLLDRGAWFWTQAAYSYALVAAGILVLLGAFFRNPRLYRGRAVLVVVAVVLSWVGNIVALFVFGAHGVDPTPFTFVVTGLLLALASSRLPLPSFLPALLSNARHRLLERMRDGVVVLDLDGRVVSMNAAASELLGRHGVAVGRRAGGILADLGAGGSRSADELHSELMLEEGDQRRFLDVVSSSLGGDGMRMGRLLVLRDVTERQEAEQALRASERKLRAIVEQFAEGFFLTDENGRVVEWNRAMEEITGRKQAEILGRFVWELHCEMAAGGDQSPQKLEQAKSQILDALSTGEAGFFGKIIDAVIAHTEGEARHVQETVFPIRIGDRLGLGHVIRDVTEKRRMEQTLHLAQMSVDGASDSIFWADPDGRLVYANEASSRRLGFAPEELLDMTVQDIDPQAPNPFSRHFREVRERGSVRFETVQRTKEGKLLPVEIVSSHVVCEGREYLFTHARDIAEQKKHEEALRESEGRFRAVFENTVIGVALFDTNGRTLRNNPALELMLGYSTEELRRLSLVDITHADDSAAERRLLHQLMLGHRDHYQLEKRFLRKGGLPLWVQVTGSLVRDDAGEPLYGIAVVVDIEERKGAEKALGESEEQLRQAQKMDAVGQLAGGIAHDFNNLLMVIIGNASLALADLAVGDPKWKFVTDIKEAGERAAGLTRQILAFSRRQILRPRVVQLNDVVAGMEPLLRRTLGEHIDLIFLQAPDLRTTEVDPHQIEQVLMNLAINARDAMPKGGLLTVETANVELDRSYCRAHPSMKPGQQVMLAVSDTGCGMSEQTQERIFEPFFTTKEVGKGTGLGLSTVFGIVKQSGGSITVNSRPGEGSTFRVYLPVAGEPAPPDEPDGPARAVRGGSETILVVEDESAARELLVRVLAGRGYRVLQAKSGRDVDYVLEGEPAPPDLLLTDVVLPGGLTGRDVADALLARDPELPVIFMSGYTRDSVGRDGRLEEGLEFLQKPFSPDTLLLKVRALLDRAGGVSATQAIPEAGGLGKL